MLAVHAIYCVSKSVSSFGRKPDTDKSKDCATTVCFDSKQTVRELIISCRQTVRFCRLKKCFSPPVGMPHPNTRPNTFGSTKLILKLKLKLKNMQPLTPFNGRHPPQKLGKDFHLAHRVTMVSRCHIWHTSLRPPCHLA